MPAKANRIPFRYEKRCSVNSLQENLSEAVSQFLRYVAARPLTRGKGPAIDAKDLREIAEALDREYGWFATPRTPAGRRGSSGFSLNRMIGWLAFCLAPPFIPVSSALRRVPRPDSAKSQPANVVAAAASSPPVSPNERKSVLLPSPAVSSGGVSKERSPEASVSAPRPPEHSGEKLAPFQPKPSPRAALTFSLPVAALMRPRGTLEGLYGLLRQPPLARCQKIRSRRQRPRRTMRLPE